MGDRVMEGSLRAISAPDLLTFINMVKKTGTLSLQAGEVVKRVYWERGEVVFATSTDPEEALGTFLVRHGKITQEQNMQSGLKVEPGKRQGKVLVQMGVLTPKELWWAVKNQVLDIIYTTFSWRDGSFTFEETEEANEEKIKLSTSTTNIIMEGIRRLDEWPRIRELIPSDRLVPIPAPAEGRDASVHFYDDELEILTYVDGRRSVRDIIYLSKLNEFETLRLLMAFIMAKYLLVPTFAMRGGQEDVEDFETLGSLVHGYNHILSEIREALLRRLKDDAVAQLFSSALEVAKSPVLEGVDFSMEGVIDPKVLAGNVADLSADQRSTALDSALSNLLSFLLFEASKHLEAAQKAHIYRMVEERATPGPAKNASRTGG